MARILASGDTALVVEFGDTAESRLSALVLSLDQRIKQAGIAGITEMVPTLRSLMVHYDPVATSHAALEEAIRPLLDGLTPDLTPGRRHTIPVCYEPELAPDLAFVAETTGVAPAEVGRLHASVVYRVYMIGFLPGHPYLGDVPEAIRLPRRQTPRTAVPPGSVAIATTMSSIYPLESPGGWHLIGRTPTSVFDLARAEPVLLAPADEVVFEPISKAEYDRLAAGKGRGA